MSLPTFIEKQFPSRTGWEWNVEAVYEVPIVVSGKGAKEKRNLPYQYPRRRITVRIPGDRQADIVLINRWHHALRGRAIGFRVQDPTDFLSIDLDPYNGLGKVTYADTTPLDQPVVAAGDTTGYRLVKEYTIELDGTVDLTQQLPIAKPVDGTIQIANNLGVTQDPSNWTLDYETGLLQTLGGFAGTPATWGGQYDLPMRFDSGLPIDVRDHRIAEVIFELMELPRSEI